jgi:hypothetical protein
MNDEFGESADDGEDEKFEKTKTLITRPSLDQI